MKTLIFCFILIFFILASSAWGKEVVIASGHPEYPPVQWKEGGKIIGSGAKLVETIFKEIGLTYEINYTGPWKRVQHNAKSGEIDLITGAYINDERRKYMEFSVPFIEDPVVVFVKKGKAFSFEKWSDLIGKTGSTTLGESYGESFDRFMEEKLTIEKIVKVEQNFKKMDAGRVDYVIFGLYPGLLEAAKAGFEDKVEVLPNPVVLEKFYIAISNKSEFIKYLPKTNKIIKRLRKTGEIDKWNKEFLDYYKLKNKLTGVE